MLFIRHPNCRLHREETLNSSGDSVAETRGSMGSASMEKFVFGKLEITYLGFIVSKNGL